MKLHVYKPDFSLKMSDVCRNVWIARVGNFVMFWGPFVITNIIYAMFILDIISVRFSF